MQWPCCDDVSRINIIAARHACNALPAQMNSMLKSTIGVSRAGRALHMQHATMTSLPENIIMAHVHFVCTHTPIGALPDWVGNPQQQYFNLHNL